MNNSTQNCCPELNVEKWDKKTIQWEQKRFIKVTMPTLFHMPLPSMLGKKMMKLHELAVKENATIEDVSEALILFRDPSAFKSEIYYAVTKEVPGADNCEISGNFESVVYDGSYNKVPVFMKEMDSYLKQTGKTAKDYYIHYAYCPKCAKNYGHNYMILFARI
jgi:hypothetical protein